MFGGDLAFGSVISEVWLVFGSVISEVSLVFGGDLAFGRS